MEARNDPAGDAFKLKKAMAGRASGCPREKFEVGITYQIERTGNWDRMQVIYILKMKVLL